MTLQVSPTQSQIQIVLRAFLLSILPQNIPVIIGQDNRVPEPANTDFVLMTPMFRRRISTNLDSYPFSPSQDPITGGDNTYTQSTEVLMQCDVHGPNASDNAEIIVTMLRDTYATDFFLNQPTLVPTLIPIPIPGITPLHADDPKQVPFQNAESQWEYRWVVEVNLQVDQVVSNVPQQFATAANVTSINVDKTFPPSH